MRISKKTFEGELTRADYTSPVGVLNIISSSKGLRAILSEEDMKELTCRAAADKTPLAVTKHSAQAIRELDEYFNGRRTVFELSLDAVGTEFQVRSWEFLRQIPFGKVCAYSEQALSLGSASWARAVGAANGCNPLTIVVPCHRVIGKSGALTGFRGGLAMKEYLLKIERQALACQWLDRAIVD